MKTIRMKPVVYELLLEKAKARKFRTIEQYLEALARE